MGEQSLLIIGAGGHGKMAADAAEQMNHWKQISFLDDQYPVKRNVLHWPVIGRTDQAQDYLSSFSDVFVALGANDQRLNMINKLNTIGFRIATLIHPTAFVSPYAQIGAGAVIAAKSVVQTSCQIGIGTIVNTAASVDHDCTLADGVHISPGAHLAGNVKVGTCSWVGLGASVIQNIVIGEYAIVGAGAVVVHDVPDGKKVMGVW